jgi:hypothetical protein
MHQSRKGATGRVFRATATAMVGDPGINGSARVVSALVADGGGGGGGVGGGDTLECIRIGILSRTIVAS